MSDHFITEFGHRIDFLPGYLERNRYYVDDAKRHAAYWAGEVSTYGQAGNGDVQIYAVAKDLVQFSACISFLQRHHLPIGWADVLDLGGGEGAIARFFKAAGFVGRAYNLDLDTYPITSDDQFFARCITAIQQMDRIEAPGIKLLKDGIARVKDLFDHHPQGPLLDGVHLDFPKPTTLDRHFEQNLFDAEGSYSLVTAFSVLEFLDLEEAFKKIRSLLVPGGMFVGATNYCWYPVYANGLIGRFPYLQQRLTLSDARRYAEAHQPELLENLDRRYLHYHQGARPTVPDWIEAARQNGLKTVAYERVMPKRNWRSPDDPQALMKAKRFDPNEVLRDIHYTHKKVSLDDLFTQALRVALVAV